jgi:hypothetical protein
MQTLVCNRPGDTAIADWPRASPGARSATGNVKSMMAGLNCVAHGETYVLVSIVRDTICLADPEFPQGETSLLGSRSGAREDFSKVYDAIR